MKNSSKFPFAKNIFAFCFFAIFFFVSFSIKAISNYWDEGFCHFTNGHEIAFYNATETKTVSTSINTCTIDATIEPFRYVLDVNEVLEIPFELLLSNDIYDPTYDIEVTFDADCTFDVNDLLGVDYENHISIQATSSSFIVTGVQPTINSNGVLFSVLICYRATCVQGGNYDNAYIQMFVTPEWPWSVGCPQTSCENLALCGDFENLFVSNEGSYFDQIGLPKFVFYETPQYGWPSNTQNTPDIMYSVDSNGDKDNQFIRLVTTHESFFVELGEPIQPGECVQIELDASAKDSSIEPLGWALGIYASQNPPCEYILNPSCGSSGVNHCFSQTGPLYLECIKDGIPIDVGWVESDLTTLNPGNPAYPYNPNNLGLVVYVENLTWPTHIIENWTNNTQDPINYIYVRPTANLGEAAEVLIDNVVVTKSDCLVDPGFSYTVTGCEVSFQVNDPTGQHEWDFGDNTTSSEANPVHVFPQIGGEFTIVHKIITGCGPITETLNISVDCPLSCDCPQNSIAMSASQTSLSRAYQPAGAAFITCCQPCKYHCENRTEH